MGIFINPPDGILGEIHEALPLGFRHFSSQHNDSVVKVNILPL